MLGLDKVLLLVYYCTDLYVGSPLSILFVSAVASVLIQCVGFLIVRCRKHCSMQAMTDTIYILPNNAVDTAWSKNKILS